MMVVWNVLDSPFPIAPRGSNYLTAAARLKPDSDVYFAAPSGRPEEC